jgi:hypothetical protein
MVVQGVYQKSHESQPGYIAIHGLKMSRKIHYYRLPGDIRFRRRHETNATFLPLIPPLSDIKMSR